MPDWNNMYGGGPSGQGDDDGFYGVRDDLVGGQNPDSQWQLCANWDPTPHVNGPGELPDIVDAKTYNYSK
jgi:hypothetical protein